MHISRKKYNKQINRFVYFTSNQLFDTTLTMDLRKRNRLGPR